MTFSKSSPGVAARSIDHLHGLWGGRWFLPLLPIVYSAIMLAAGNLRWQHLAAAVVIAALGFGSEWTKRLLVLAFPVLLVVMAFDVLGYAQPLLVVPQRILGCQMRAFELALFAQAPNVTWQDYFAMHHTPFFDLYFAIPYGIFIYVLISYGAYLFFTDKRRLRQYIWAISIAYLVAIAFWLAMPVAPPWYIRAHGCVIDITAPASAAGLIRADRLLGFHYFESFYAQSPAIYAAFPSMHCAFPVIGMLIAWPRATWMTRPIHILYAGSMWVGSLYLDHHWVGDGFAGWLLAAIAVFSARTIVPSGRSHPRPKRPCE